ncbi:hypothetical protein [Janthinobacterium sp. LB3P118]|uniref:hypothetical protein n=1 Tax=Janthinobacterium sp. LB3P118 TaxID=3424195 RepID=UPI003F27DF29
MWFFLDGPVAFSIGPFLIQKAKQPFTQMFHRGAQFSAGAGDGAGLSLQLAQRYRRLETLGLGRLTTVILWHFDNSEQTAWQSAINNYEKLKFLHIINFAATISFFPLFLRDAQYPIRMCSVSTSAGKRTRRCRHESPPHLIHQHPEHQRPDAAACPAADGQAC